MYISYMYKYVHVSTIWNMNKVQHKGKQITLYGIVLQAKKLKKLKLYIPVFLLVQY